VLYGSHFGLHSDGKTEFELLVNWLLRGICGPKKEEVAGSWRKSDNEKLNNL
jgi:hypothetical protein